MNLYIRMKQKLSRFAVRNLSLIVTGCFIAGYLLEVIGWRNGIDLYESYLAFDPCKVLHGQVWRILTAILCPPVRYERLLLVGLCIYVYYGFASVIERTMGDFDFNLYCFGSLLIGELGSILYYLITKNTGVSFYPTFAHFSVLLPFAILYPEATVLWNFLIPVKSKWIAIVEVIIYVWLLITGNLYTKISIIAAFIPVVIFYLIVRKNRSGADIISRIRFQIAQKKRQKEWKNQWK